MDICHALICYMQRGCWYIFSGQNQPSQASKLPWTTWHCGGHLQPRTDTSGSSKKHKHEVVTLLGANGTRGVAHLGTSDNTLRRNGFALAIGCPLLPEEGAAHGIQAYNCNAD
eukprot:scaffold14967_cov17-Prasinocladus_malaysianus.AAC.3